MPDRSAQIEAAIQAVRCASRLCQQVQGRLVRPQTIQKQDRSPVTVADFASQAVVCAMLGEALGDVSVVGEEAAAALRDDAQAAVRDVVVEHVCGAMRRDVPVDQVMQWIDRGGADPATVADGRYWTVDPIDGTKGFLRGEQYVVALALIEQGQVTLGVLGCPNLPHDGGSGSILVAEQGRGARLLPLEGDAASFDAGQAVNVSDVSDPGEARFCESVESGHSDQDLSQQIAATLGITTDPLRMDSQAKYAVIARGQASIYMRLPTRGDYREKIWDHAAGMIIVEEAGGRVTDVTGAPLDFSQGRRLENNSGVIATNGRLHEAVLAAVKGAMGE